MTPHHTPSITRMQVIPVAGHDGMLMNLSGAHGPFFTRNIVILTDSSGHTGLGEVPGGEKIRQTLKDARALVEGQPIGQYNAVLQAMRQQLDGGYGIFGGYPKDWAELRFSAARSGWVQHESWHPQQQSQLHADGSYTLRVPYADERELIGDILRFGGEVDVLKPLALRTKVQTEIARMAQVYAPSSGPATVT
jgi:hypothetical protein